MADSQAQNIQNIRLGWFGLSIAGGFIFWLRIEDIGGKYALILGAGISIWSWSQVWLKRGINWRTPSYGIIGALIGFSTPFVAILIIIFKGGIHGHGFLDLSIIEIRDILQSAPSWGVFGAAGGFILNWISIAYNRTIRN